MVFFCNDSKVAFSRLRDKRQRYTDNQFLLVKRIYNLLEYLNLSSSKRQHIN